MSLVMVRYIVDDVDDAIGFYREHLGFTVEMHPATTFAIVSRGDLRLLLSAPSERGGGGQVLPHGRRPQPGGWNRISLIVEDLPAEVERLRASGVRFRTDVVYGVGGDQVLVEDPSGNPVELFQPKRRSQDRRPSNRVPAVFPGVPSADFASSLPGLPQVRAVMTGWSG